MRLVGGLGSRVSCPFRFDTCMVCLAVHLFIVVSRMFSLSIFLMLRMWIIGIIRGNAAGGTHLVSLQVVCCSFIFGGFHRGC